MQYWHKNINQRKPLMQSPQARRQNTLHWQQGFTLLEMMVALAIFAMLSVAGWQLFDSLNRTKERTQVQAKNLANLQYAYLQIQKDMAQVVYYPQQTKGQANVTNNSQKNNLKNNKKPTSEENPDNNIDNNTKPQDSKETKTSRNNEGEMTDIDRHSLTLTNNQLEFIRYADPDPRYQTSPTLQRIAYLIADNKLIRRQYFTWQKNQQATDTNLSSGNINSTSIDSVLLDNIENAQWQALLPEPTNQFPTATQTNANVSPLPKGLELNLNYQQQPITWKFALFTLNNNPNNNK